MPAWPWDDSSSDVSSPCLLLLFVCMFGEKYPSINAKQGCQVKSKNEIGVIYTYLKAEILEGKKVREGQ